MNEKSHDADWPEEAGDPGRLAREMPPPPELEDRVVAALHRRGLLVGEGGGTGTGGPWLRLRPWAAAAAATLLLVAGAAAGRLSAPAATDPVAPAALTGAATDLYALLLYETSGYSEDPAGQAELYSAYSAWVREAVVRDQFAGGEDLEVARGWVLESDPDGEEVTPGVSPEGGPALSGLFFIRADSHEQALELARELPHLRNGGQVVVQKTLPTASPPGN